MTGCRSSSISISGDNQLDSGELRRLLKGLGMRSISDEELTSLVVELDTDKSGYIDFDEFNYWYACV
jgi:Ca2+-binding EF-hand superfamily protein